MLFTVYAACILQPLVICRGLATSRSAWCHVSRFQHRVYVGLDRAVAITIALTALPSWTEDSKCTNELSHTAASALSCLFMTLCGRHYAEMNFKHTHICLIICCNIVYITFVCCVDLGPEAPPGFEDQCAYNRKGALWQSTWIDAARVRQ